MAIDSNDREIAVAVKTLGEGLTVIPKAAGEVYLKTLALAELIITNKLLFVIDNRYDIFLSHRIDRTIEVGMVFTNVENTHFQKQITGRGNIEARSFHPSKVLQL